MKDKSTGRARIYDIVALLIALIVIALDQWTKMLVVANFSPPDGRDSLSLVGPYLVVEYIQNRGAAFSLLENNVFLIVLILIALLVIAYLYVRILNAGPMQYKLIFGLIIGGAAGNLIDRFHNGGAVVDFISFRIPQIGFRFAIFNVADACISVGVFLLFVFILFGGLRRSDDEKKSVGRTSNETFSNK